VDAKNLTKNRANAYKRKRVRQSSTRASAPQGVDAAFEFVAAVLPLRDVRL